MAAVTRLVTFVDFRDTAAPGQMPVAARHEALLADGRRVPLLDDRGWSSSGNVPDVWAATSVEAIEETARSVVGPDEPFAGRSQEDMEAEGWAYLAGVLRERGVVVDAVRLRGLPHDVVLGEPLLARLGVDRT